MLRIFASLCLFLAAAMMIYLASPAAFYLKPKQERLYSLWQRDFQHLVKNKEFQRIFTQLAQVEIHFNDPQVAEEFKDFKSPFKINPQGEFVLKISITRWIEPKEYGYVIEHELFDLSEDKINEFGRTYKVGFIF